MHTVALNCKRGRRPAQIRKFLDLIHVVGQTRTKKMKATGARSLAETTSRRRRATTGTANQPRSNLRLPDRQLSEKSKV